MKGLDISLHSRLLVDRFSVKFGQLIHLRSTHSPYTVYTLVMRKLNFALFFGVALFLIFVPRVYSQSCPSSISTCEDKSLSNYCSCFTCIEQNDRIEFSCTSDPSCSTNVFKQGGVSTEVSEPSDTSSANLPIIASLVAASIVVASAGFYLERSKFLKGEGETFFDTLKIYMKSVLWILCSEILDETTNEPRSIIEFIVSDSKLLNILRCRCLPKPHRKRVFVFRGLRFLSIFLVSVGLGLVYGKIQLNEANCNSSITQEYCRTGSRTSNNIKKSTSCEGVGFAQVALGSSTVGILASIYGMSISFVTERTKPGSSRELIAHGCIFGLSTALLFIIQSFVSSNSEADQSERISLIVMLTLIGSMQEEVFSSVENGVYYILAKIFLNRLFKDMVEALGVATSVVKNPGDVAVNVVKQSSECESPKQETRGSALKLLLEMKKNNFDFPEELLDIVKESAHPKLEKVLEQISEARKNCSDPNNLEEIASQLG